MICGYARVSTDDQSLDVQLEQLGAAGCTKVFSEKRSGATREGRDELAKALAFVREGDTFVVTKLDRMARSLSDLIAIVRDLEARGVHFKALAQGIIDTTTASGKLVIAIFGAFSEFELDMRAERQSEGIAKAKADGRYTGRKARIAAKDVVKLKNKGMGASEIARTLRCSPRTVYRHCPTGWAEKPTTDPKAKVW